MVAAGDIISASDVNTRENTTVLTADSTAWSTTEVVAASITITAVFGQKYKVWFTGKISTDAGPGTDASNMRIREDTVAGNQMVLAQVWLQTTTGNGWATHFYAEWTAGAAGAKTFVVTGQRSIGTGVGHRVRASANAPGYLAVEKVVGA